LLRSSYSNRTNQSKRVNDRSVTLPPSNPDPPVRYHSWKPEYNQVNNREKIKKSMTKDPYTTIKPPMAHATESITTEEECCLNIIPANAVRIEKPVIHIAKVPGKFNFLSIIYI
jgi:hypothetical protein